MTTTNMFQGLQGEKNSSRVLRPPGGGSSNIFCTEPEADSKKGQPSDSNIFGPAEARAPPPRPREDTNTKLFGIDASPSKKKPEKDEEGDKEKENSEQADEGAVGDTKTEEPQAAAGVSSVKHVRQPPGGKSTPLW